jgi:hypothetical protein
MSVVHVTTSPKFDAGACVACGSDWRTGDPIVTLRIADGLSASRASAWVAPAVAAPKRLRCSTRLPRAQRVGRYDQRHP